jgi:hypothetical protein
LQNGLLIYKFKNKLNEFSKSSRWDTGRGAPTPLVSINLPTKNFHPIAIGFQTAAWVEKNPGMKSFEILFTFNNYYAAVAQLAEH